jgi:hypothetical protein
MRPSSLFKKDDSFLEAGSVTFRLVEAELIRTDGTFVCHRSNDYDSVYRTNSVGTPYPFLWGQYYIQFLKSYIFLFLNNGQRIEPKNAQNDSDVAYLNMN